MAHRYLVESLEGTSRGDVVVVTGAEAHHAVAVSRIHAGARLTIGDGVGLVATGEVVRAERDRLELRVDALERVPHARPAVTLVQALAKGDRDELAVQAATELGVDRIVPWAAARSVARWNEAKAAKGRERWCAIAREATKQSLRAWLPEVGALVSTKQLAALASRARMLVLDPTASARVSALELDDRDLILVVGPEGGIAPEEFDALAGAGAEPVRLGAEVLRTSTAGPAAIAVISAALGRW